MVAAAPTKISLKLLFFYDYLCGKVFSGKMNLIPNIFPHVFAEFIWSRKDFVMKK